MLETTEAIEELGAPSRSEVETAYWLQVKSLNWEKSIFVLLAFWLFYLTMISIYEVEVFYIVKYTYWATASYFIWYIKLTLKRNLKNFTKIFRKT